MGVGVDAGVSVDVGFGIKYGLGMASADGARRTRMARVVKPLPAGRLGDIL